MPRERALPVAVVLLFFSVLVTPAQRDLFVGDETKYGQVVREMRATGAFFLPTLNGAPFTHKPPLHFWAIDLLTFPLGVYSTWAFVLPSIAAFAFLLWLMWRIGGPLAAYVCGSSLMIWVSAQTARMDVAFTALIALGLWQMEKFFERDDGRALLWCGVALGVATLVKGPMAIVIGLVLFVLELWRRRGSRSRVSRRDGKEPALSEAKGSPAPKRKKFIALALLLMIVIPLVWFIPAILMGGRDYARDIMVKQTVGRAIASWVHKAPPWFYLERLPLALFPWFFLALAAAIALWRTHRFLINWIIAVVVPYSLMSSKLDVYMMAMIPAVALLVAEYVRRCVIPSRPSASLRAGSGGEGFHTRWARIANLIVIGIVFVGAIVGGAKMPREFESVAGVNGLIAFTLIVSLAAFVIAARASLVTSTMMAGAVPVAVLLFVGLNLMPFVNGFGSTQALVIVLERQKVAPEEIALYSTPYLWTRDLPRRLERVVYADRETLLRAKPSLIVTSRRHAQEIAAALAGYRKVDEVRMIGKWFDVYRR